MMATLLMQAAMLSLALMQPQTTEGGFSLDLPIKRELLKKARTIVQADETTIFIPGASGLSGDLQLGQGPVARLKARSGSRGLAITLSPRDSFSKAGQPAIVLSPKPHLRVGSMQESSSAPQKSLATAPQQSTSSPGAGSEASLGWDTRKVKKGAAPTPWAQRLVPAALVLVALCGAGLFLVRRRRGQATHNASTISVVAARSLGARHKLAVVQVDGERLLLAMSDRDVSLISHLASSDPAVSAQVGGAAHFALPQGSMPASPASVPAPSMPRQDAAPSTPSTSGFSSDVAGLLSLRQPAVDAAAQKGGAP